MKPEVDDYRPERSHLRPESTDARPESSDLRPEMFSMPFRSGLFIHSIYLVLHSAFNREMNVSALTWPLSN